MHAEYVNSIRTNCKTPDVLIDKIDKLKPIASGWHSLVYRIGDTIYKIPRKLQPLTGIGAGRETAQQELDTLVQYCGEFLPPGTEVISYGKHSAQYAIKMRYINGRPLKSSDINDEDIALQWAALMTACETMREKSGYTLDFTGTRGIHDMLRRNSTHVQLDNIFIEQETKRLYIIDTGLCKPYQPTDIWGGIKQAVLFSVNHLVLRRHFRLKSE